jgi:hypothetical protein
MNNRIILQTIFLIIAFIFNAIGDKNPSAPTWAAEMGASDSVVLKDPFEEDMPYYSKIEVYRKGILIFTFNDSTAEFYGGGDIFTEYRFDRWPNSYLIFRCSGRPSDDYFMVLEKTEKGYRNLGYTPNSTAEIFGDIDEDGVFEIGGFENLHEGGSTLKEFKEDIKREYKIFEIRPGFPLDKDLMKVMLPIILTNRIRDFKK